MTSDGRYIRDRVESRTVCWLQRAMSGAWEHMEAFQKDVADAEVLVQIRLNDPQSPEAVQTLEIIVACGRNDEVVRAGPIERADETLVRGESWSNYEFGTLQLEGEPIRRCGSRLRCEKAFLSQL